MTAVQGQGAHLPREEDGQQGWLIRNSPTYPPKPLTGQLPTLQGKPHPEDEEVGARGREEAPQGHEEDPGNAGHRTTHHPSGGGELGTRPTAALDLPSEGR